MIKTVSQFLEVKKAAPRRLFSSTHVKPGRPGRCAGQCEVSPKNSSEHQDLCGCKNSRCSLENSGARIQKPESSKTYKMQLGTENRLLNFLHRRQISSLPPVLMASRRSEHVTSVSHSWKHSISELCQRLR